MMLFVLYKARVLSYSQESFALTLNIYHDRTRINVSPLSIMQKIQFHIAEGTVVFIFATNIKYNQFNKGISL